MNNTKDIKFSHKSMVDDFGRVFFYDNRVFRKISQNKKEECIELLNSELFNVLLVNKLIPSTVISKEFSTENELILEHKKILETLQHEWSYQMYKDAALMVLEVNKICNNYGYELKDAHTQNVLFDNYLPVFIDLGSISKINKNARRGEWAAYDEFLNSFLTPLLFWSYNKHYIVRKLLESNFHRMLTIPFQSLSNSGLLQVINIPSHQFSVNFRNKIVLKFKRESSFLKLTVKLLNYIAQKFLPKRRNFLKYKITEVRLNEIYPQERVFEEIKNLSNPNVKSEWNGYHKKFYNEFGTIKYSNRFNRILEIAQNLNDIESVIDLAGNEGYLSILLSEMTNVNRIVLADYDENVIDCAYLTLKEKKISKITPVLLNFMFTNDLIGTAQRYSSDLVIALAITHHLILTDNFSLATIFERLTMYSKKYVIVEFMPLGLWSIEHKQKINIPEWYTKEWFREEFCNHFELLIEEKLEENRILYLGKISKY